jgi:hypothetical protein
MTPAYTCFRTARISYVLLSYRRYRNLCPNTEGMSMSQIAFDERTDITREAISKTCEAAGMFPPTRREVSGLVQEALPPHVRPTPMNLNVKLYVASWSSAYFDQRVFGRRRRGCVIRSQCWHACRHRHDRIAPPAKCSYPLTTPFLNQTR